MKPIPGSTRGQPGAMGASVCVLRHPELRGEVAPCSKGRWHGGCRSVWPVSGPAQQPQESLGWPLGGGHPVLWWVVLRRGADEIQTVGFQTPEQRKRGAE